MSRENVEMVKRGYEHFATTGDVLVEIMHPDFVWDMSKFRDWPEQQIYPGLEGARQFLSDWGETWDGGWELEVRDLLDAGDQVVAIMHQRGSSTASGLTVEMDFAQVWSVRDGKQIRMDMYADPAEALEAVGLRE
jgi:ketosteroid isomerase-like protein